MTPVHLLITIWPSHASAYLGVITHWIETGMKESSEEMALIAMRLLFIRPGNLFECEEIHHGNRSWSI